MREVRERMVRAERGDRTTEEPTLADGGTVQQEVVLLCDLVERWAVGVGAPGIAFGERVDVLREGALVSAPLDEHLTAVVGALRQARENLLGMRKHFETVDAIVRGDRPAMAG